MTAISINQLGRYSAPKKDNWSGRIDGPTPERIHEVIELVDLNKANQLESFPKESCGIIGFACDVGVKRNQGNPGANLGPDSLRKALGRLPCPFENCHIFDFGDIRCDDEDLETSQMQLGLLVNYLIGKGVFPIVLGGGHEVAWGNYQGIAQAYPNDDITVVNFDAHFDLRPLLPNGKGSSGTSFTQIAEHRKQQKLPFNYTCLGIQSTGATPTLFKKAEELKVEYALAEEFHIGGIVPINETLDDVIIHSNHIYLTICLDVFASAFAPGVSAPQPLGLYPWHVIPLIQQLASSQKVVGLNIAELCPPRDRDDMTANLAASLIFHFLRTRSMPF